MFEKLTLRKPFKNLFKKVIQECKKDNYKSKKDEIDVIKLTMEKLIDDLTKKKLSELRDNSNMSLVDLNQRMNKTKSILFNMLNKEIEKMMNKLTKDIK